MTNVFNKLDGVPVASLNSPENLAEYLELLQDNAIINNLSGYGKEIKHLSENNYIFNINSKKFIK